MLERADVSAQPHAASDQAKTQGRELAFVIDLDLDAVANAHIPCVRLLVCQQTLVRTKMQRWPHFQFHSRWPFEQPVNDVARVLQVRHHHALLDADAVLRESPRRKAAVEEEFLEESLLRIGDLFSAAVLVAAEAIAASVRRPHDSLAVID